VTPRERQTESLPSSRPEIRAARSEDREVQREIEKMLPDTGRIAVPLRLLLLFLLLLLLLMILSKGL
jgi:hypothetical protein